MSLKDIVIFVGGAFSLDMSINTFRPQIRVGNGKLFLLISQPKHMFKLMGKKIITILRLKISLSGSM